MMYIHRSLAVLALLLVMPQAGQALLLTGQDIITAPGSVIDDFPGAENDHQQAFNEAQDVTLLANLSVDLGVIAAGAIVDSHMIFLNSEGSTRVDDLGVDWTFDGKILGVMSNYNGSMEIDSTPFLGAVGTIYPTTTFSARGMEGGDSYVVLGSKITVNMSVTEPGDWIRVVTQSSEVPEPTSMLLLGAGLFGLAARRRKTAS